MNESLKVQPHHLERGAYLYVHQSSMRQVIENIESTTRQYALRGRAIALGWRDDQIVVIDNDQGESGASAAGREGLQRLVTDVGMGHAGIVRGLEVSRLARNNADWHRLLEICALAYTLILDEDGVYDPASFNDRLLLGLKGTMSEAELHVLKARLRGGILNQAAQSVDTGVPMYEMRTLDPQVENSLVTERLPAALSTVFGSLATLLAAIGLGIGLPAAWVLTRLVQSQLFGIQPSDPLTMVLAGSRNRGLSSGAQGHRHRSGARASVRLAGTMSLRAA